MSEPVISDMRRVDKPPNEAGVVLLARFSCRVGGMLLVGVKLMRRQEGDLAVSNIVSGGGNSGTPRGVLIEDEGLRAAILAAATAALDAAPPEYTDSPRRHRRRRIGGQ